MTEANLTQPLIPNDLPGIFPQIKKPDSDLSRQQYNPIKIPPDIILAQRHGLATRTCRAQT